MFALQCDLQLSLLVGNAIDDIEIHELEFPGIQALP